MAKNRPNIPGSTTPTAPAAGGGPAGGATAGCSQCTITSQTEATNPADRARKRIGVGERATLTVSPAPATWSVSGGGQLSSTSGASVTFTAGDVGGSATITAQTAACSCTIELEVVAPNGVHMERVDSRGLHHIHGTPSVGFVGKPFILPADVSFENIEYREEEAQAVGTGFLSGMTGQGHHPIPGFLTVGAVVEGTGSESDGFDEVTITISSVTPPMANGSVTWSIPWVYQVGSGGEHPLATVDQVATIDAQGSMTISKGGASATRALNDPTSHLDTSLP